MIGRYALVLSLLVSVSNAIAQESAFEAASIKVNNSAKASGGMGPRGDRFVATNVTLKALVIFAYSSPSIPLLDSQVVGLPGWANDIRFDINAKAGSEAPISLGQMQGLVKALLGDRFAMKVHREMRNLPVYNLVATKKGPTPSGDQTPVDPTHAVIRMSSQGGERSAGLPRGGLTMVTGATNATLVGQGVSVSTLISLLRTSADRIIVDKTNFDKLLDIDLTFSRDDLATSSATSGLRSSSGPDSPIHDPSQPSLFSAVQQIGFKLESASAPLSVVVVDNVQHPSEN